MLQEHGYTTDMAGLRRWLGVTESSALLADSTVLVCSMACGPFVDGESGVDVLKDWASDVDGLNVVFAIFTACDIHATINHRRY